MRTATQQSYRRPFSSTQIFSRPKTAQAYSFKKLTQILQGKYMSIQNKVPNKMVKLSQDKKSRQTIVLSQNRLQNDKKIEKNALLENCKSNKQSNVNVINLLNFEDLKLRTQFRPSTNKQIGGTKQNSFVPYAQQEKQLTVSQPNIKTQKVAKTKRRVTKQNKQKLQNQLTQQQADMIESWKNEQEQNMKFSSLFKKSWRF